MWLRALATFLNFARRRLGRSRSPSSLSGHAARRIKRSTEPLETRTMLAAPHDFNLSGVDGANGFRATGLANSDVMGRAVTGLGDVNGDGLEDLLLGAPGNSPNANFDAGQSYLVFGTTDQVSSGILDVEQRSLRFNGENFYDFSGYSVGRAGDINGDGFADLIIGAYGFDQNGAVFVGASYVVFGSSTLVEGELNLSALDGSNGFRLIGINTQDNSSASVGSAGDFNGDGFDDLIIGAPGTSTNTVPNVTGEAYIVFGRGSFTNTSGSINLSVLAIDNPVATGFSLTGIDKYDSTGISVDSAGDINGDGLDDVILGSERADPLANDAGEVHVIFGQVDISDSLDENGDFQLSSIDGENGFQLQGPNSIDRTGSSVSGAGDVNGDGFDDLIVGAEQATLQVGQTSRPGVAYLVFGKTDWRANNGELNIAQLNGAGQTQGFRFEGIRNQDFTGRSVAAAGDIDGDGFADLIIGADGAGDGQNGDVLDHGEAFVIFGDTFDNLLVNLDDLDGTRDSNVDLSLLDGTNGFEVEGRDSSDFAGFSVDGNFDFNGDGFDDIVIGAPAANPDFFNYTGESYVLFGGDFNDSVTHSGSDIADNNDNVFIGGAEDDVMEGRDGVDIFHGGAGNDILSTTDLNLSGALNLDLYDGGTGTDTLRFDGAGMNLDLPNVPDNRIVDIEEIDIRGTGANSLKLNFLEVINLSSTSNSLLVRRGFDDTVDIGSGWAEQPNETINNELFSVFTQGVAVLKVQINTAGKNVGVFRPGSSTFFLDALNDGAIDHAINFGLGTDTPLVGDFDGDGDDDVGLYRASNSTFFLQTDSDATVEIVLPYGTPGDIPLVGDWDGDGTDEIGIFRPSSALFSLNFDTDTTPDMNFRFGMNGDVPIVGDWDGDNDDDVGIFRPNGARWFLDTDKNGILDIAFNFGGANDTPLVGDWDGDGSDDAGIHRSSNSTFYQDFDENGSINRAVRFGASTDTPLIGDWDGDDDEDIGLFRSSTSTFFMDSNSDGAIDETVRFGASTDIPVVGNWALNLTTVGTGSRSDDATAVSNDQLQPLVDAAIEIWAGAGLSTSEVNLLKQVEVRIADLPGDQLGQAVGSTILLDKNAARIGWFIDLTPYENEEFVATSSTTFKAQTNSEAAGRVDLLTVLLHEFGHILGRSHIGHLEELMNEVLLASNRRLPNGH